MCPVCFFYGILAFVTAGFITVTSSIYFYIIGSCVIGFCVYKIYKMNR
jgi:hypothetical protein